MQPERSRLSWERYVAIGSLVVILTFGAVAWTTFARHLVRSPGTELADIDFGQDLRGFQAAGSLASDRLGEALYDPERAEFVAVGAALPLNPPWFSVAVIPVSWLPFGLVFPLWTLAGISLIAMALRRLGIARVGTLIVILLVTLAGFFNVWYGQVAFFFTALVASSVLLLERRKGMAGASLLALAAFKPHLLLGFVVWWLVDARRRWRWIIVGLGTTICLVAVSWWWLPGGWSAWFHRLPDTSSLVRPDTEVTVWATARLAFGESTAALIVAMGLSAVVLALLLSGLRRAADVGTCAALAIVASVLLAVHGLVYDWTVLLVAGALLVRSGALASSEAGLIGLVLGAVLYGGDQMTAWQLDMFGRALHLAPLVLLATFAWIVTQLEHRSDRQGQAIRETASDL